MRLNNIKCKMSSQLGRVFNKFLSRFGVKIVKTEKQPWLKGASFVTTRVGRFSIDVPSISPLATYYTKNPAYSLQLGRLASVVKTKYPKLKVIDVGANVGDTACIIKTAEEVPMLCVEGDPFIFPFLEKNVRKLGGVTAHQLFMGEKTGAISANFDKSGWNTTIQPDKTNAAPLMQITSMDDFIAGQSGRADIKLVKIDAEGFDCLIIRGGKEFIREVSPVITFEYNRENMSAIGENGLDTLSMLAKLDYSEIVYHDNAGRFICSTTISNESLVQDLHEYADGSNGEIYYYDITIFHKNDSDLARVFEQGERRERSK